MNVVPFVVYRKRPYLLPVLLACEAQLITMFCFPAVLTLNCTPAVLLPELTAGYVVLVHAELSLAAGSPDPVPLAYSEVPFRVVPPMYALVPTPVDGARVPVAVLPSGVALLKFHWAM